MKKETIRKYGKVTEAVKTPEQHLTIQKLNEAEHYSPNAAQPQDDLFKTWQSFTTCCAFKKCCKKYKKGKRCKDCPKQK